MAAPATDDALSPDTRNRWAPQRGRTWFGIAGGPLAWGLQLAGGWYVSGNACLTGDPRWGALSGADARALELLVAAIAIGVALAALAVALLDWRASDNRRVTEIHATGRPDFLAAVSVLVSTAFVLAVLYGALAQLVLPLCVTVR